MRQKDGESVTHFLALLHAQGRFCEFRVACPNEMNCDCQGDYSNDMGARQMIAGLATTKHQENIGRGCYPHHSSVEVQQVSQPGDNRKVNPSPPQHYAPLCMSNVQR